MELMRYNLIRHQYGGHLDYKYFFDDYTLNINSKKLTSSTEMKKNGNSNNVNWITFVFFMVFLFNGLFKCNEC